MTLGTTIGYIGLGAMGGAMARNLLRKGREVMVLDARPHVLEDFARLGASTATSAGQVAEECDIVLTSLPGTPEVREVYLGDDGIVQGATPGTIAVDMSTIPPQVSREIAESLRARGAAMIDAPVARTKQAAEDGTLAIMVGGEAADLERVRPVLEDLGTSISHVGPLGSGNIAKLVNNAVLMANILAVCEGLVLGHQAGVDVPGLAKVLSEGSADSFALRNHVIGSVLPDTFGANRFPLTYAIKDIDYFFATGEEHGLVSPVLRTMGDFYRAAIDHGYSSEYFPVVAKVLDEMNRSKIVGSGPLADG